MSIDIVPVTQAHIDAGVRQTCRGCPIAIALSNHMGYSVMVKFASASINGVEYGLMYLLRRFIFSFDHSISQVKPCSLIVNHESREIGLIGEMGGEN